MKINLVISGVGGQGVVTIARLLAAAGLRDGLHVIQGELHGMSQRGGAVHAQLRFDNEVIESPQVPIGRADILLGVEPVEALRNIGWLHPKGRVITAIRPIENVPNYPPIEDILENIRALPNSLLVDAHTIASDAGSARSENFVMAGAAAAFLPIDPETMRACILEKSKHWAEKDRAAAIKALDAGLEIGCAAGGKSAPVPST